MSLLLQKKLSHIKVESSVQHAELKAQKEVVNKTKDETHTFIVCEFLDDFTAIIYALNTSPLTGKTVQSRVYVVCMPCLLPDVKFYE